MSRTRRAYNTWVDWDNDFDKKLERGQVSVPLKTRRNQKGCHNEVWAPKHKRTVKQFVTKKERKANHPSTAVILAAHPDLDKAPCLECGRHFHIDSDEWYPYSENICWQCRYDIDMEEYNIADEYYEMINPHRNDIDMEWLDIVETDMEDDTCSFDYDAASDTYF